MEPTFIWAFLYLSSYLTMFHCLMRQKGRIQFIAFPFKMSSYLSFTIGSLKLIRGVWSGNCSMVWNTWCWVSLSRRSSFPMSDWISIHRVTGIPPPGKCVRSCAHTLWTTVIPVELGDLFLEETNTTCLFQNQRKSPYFHVESCLFTY